MSDNPILDLEQQLRSAHVRLQGQPLARCVGERQPRFGWPGAGDRKRRGFRRWRALPVLAALLVMGGAATAAVILSSQKSGPLAGQLPPAWSVGQLPSNRYELELAPDLAAGQVAWCATFETLENAKATSFGTGECSDVNGPYAVEGGSSGITNGQTGSGSMVFYDVLTPEVAAVRLTIGHLTRLIIPVRNRHLPNGWKVAVAAAPYEGPTFTRTRHGLVAHFHGVPPTLTPLDRQLKTIPVNQNSGTSIITLPTKTVDPRDPPANGCAIRVRPLAGLVPVRETALGETLQATIAGSEPGYLSCASVELEFDGQQAVAAILLDAQHRGTSPAPLPGTRPLAAHSDLYLGPGAENVGLMSFGFAHNATILARRVGNAWLVLQAAGTIHQREAILNSLQPTA